MMKALRGNLAILALAPALVMLALGIAVLRPAQTMDALLKAGLPGSPIHAFASAATADNGLKDDLPAAPQPRQSFVCKIMLCTGIMDFPAQEPPLRSSIAAGKLPPGPALVPEDAMARRDDPPPKSRSSIFS